MKNRSFTFDRKALFLLLAFGTIVLSSFMLPGCSDRVTGDQFENQQPLVYFVNIPPDGFKVSVNPAVHWVGTDGDGLVTMFRYIVVVEEDMGGLTPQQYATSTLPGLDESMWTYLDVTVDDPQTTNIVQVSADLDDPVSRFVRQYIFVQAFDDLGLGSEIKFRLVLRNDYPPDTRVYGVDTERIYINAEVPGAIGTGVPFLWEAEDPDLEDSLFQHNWMVYGPYEDSVFEEILDEFVIPVFVGNDALVYKIGDGDTIWILDTTFNELGVVVDTTLILVDTITGDNFYGSLDTEYLDLEDPDFTGSPEYFKPLDSSWNGVDGWIEEESDTLWNLFRNTPTDSTIVRRYLINMRSRDEAGVVDLTSSWTHFHAIEPRYERDVMVLDFGPAIGRINAPYINVGDTMWDGTPAELAQEYWENVIEEWGAQSPLVEPGGLDFNVDDDYLLVSFWGNRVALKTLLQHKVLILYNDDIEKSGITDGIVPSSNLGSNIYTAIDAGVNAWLTMRAPIQGSKNTGTTSQIIPDASYSRYFGVEELTYSGWGYHAFDVSGQRETHRIEDFIGAVSMDEEQWPSLAVDSNLLHARYYWSLQFPQEFPGWGYPFRWGGGIYTPLPDDLRALPEVNWASRIYGTEVMYLYESYYERSHPLGEPLSFHGAPVAHRNNAGVFKTVHFCFTPLGMEEEKMQLVINNVLDWLYSPNLGSPPRQVRYPDARNPISIAEARANYWKRVADEMEPEELLSKKELGLQ